MTRKPLIFSLICIVGLTAFALITWLSLPELDQYPIHWNAKGEADGFADRNGVLVNLLIIPTSQIFMTVLFFILPKIEPLRKNLEDSRAAYNWVCIGLMAFLTLTGIMIIMMYRGGDSETQTAAMLLATSLGMSLLFIGIGNILGKVRQNFMLGIRTPWTLTSEMSWEKTHRLGGKLFVLVGIIGLLLSIFNPLKAIIGVTIILLIVVVICFIYSYKIWKGDPNKRS